MKAPENEQKKLRENISEDAMKKFATQFRGIEAVSLKQIHESLEPLRKIQRDFEHPLLNINKAMSGLNHAAEAFNKMSLQPHSAKGVHEQSKWLNDHLKYEREKAIRAREVDDSIISMSEQQEKTNNYLEHNHKLTQEQVKLMGILVEAQNTVLREQVRSSEEARRAAQIQFWMNMIILILTIVGVGYAVAEFHKR